MNVLEVGPKFALLTLLIKLEFDFYNLNVGPWSFGELPEAWVDV